MLKVGQHAWEIADATRRGERSARETLDVFLAAIEERNEELNAFVFLAPEQAESIAESVDERLRRGIDPGPLAGVPVGIKELMPVEGWPSTLASPLFADRVAPYTATIVSRLLAAGAVPVGLTASPEFGRASFTASGLHGVTRNPWNVARTPGGSSGGSAAAVAAGLVPLATGSDGAGSIRIPASFSGLVGLKGTFGLIPQGPGFVDSSHREGLGGLTRSVRDTLRFLDCVVGADEMDPTSLPAPPFRFEEAVPRLPLERPTYVWSEDLGFAPCDPEVATVCRDTATALMSALGGVEVEFSLELPDAGEAFRLLSVPQVYRALRAFKGERLSELPATVAQYFDANALTAETLVDAYEMRFELVSRIAEAFSVADFILTPATQTVAFAAEGPMPTSINGKPVSHQGSIGVTFVFNLSGHPAVSVPAGTVDGLPVGLQIVARRHRDAEVLALAAALERIKPWPTLN